MIPGAGGPRTARRSASWRRRPARLLGLLALLLLACPLAAVAQTRVLYRSQPAPPAIDTAAPLAEGASVRLAGQVLDISSATALRVESPDPAVRVVLRFRPGSAPDALDLTILVDSRTARRTFQYREDSAVLRDGRIQPRRGYTVDAGVETALATATATVGRVIVQDDGGAELRITRQGPQLLLTVLPPAFGGEPVGDPPPYFLRAPLTMLDYDVLGSGYTDNGYGEAWLFDQLGLRATAVLSGGDTQVLTQVVLRAPVVRWEHTALWMEGGVAVHQLLLENADEQEDATVTTALGATYLWRSGDWGAAGHVAFIGDEPFLLTLGGWQWLDWLALVLHWQSFDGYSGFGLGAALDF